MPEKFKEILKQRFGKRVTNVTTSKFSEKDIEQLEADSDASAKEARRLRKEGADPKVINRRTAIAMEIAKKAEKMRKDLKK